MILNIQLSYRFIDFHALFFRGDICGDASQI
jgi:hypothetical protein